MTDITAATWVSAVSDAELRQQCGPGAFQRGADYARRARVRTLVAGDGGRVVLATVGGSGGEDYQVVIRSSGHHWTSRCSCPVGGGCKHVVATMLTVRERIAGRGQPAAPVPVWERTLTPMLGTLDATSTSLPPLALELSLLGGRRVAGGFEPGQRVHLRPLVLGKRGKWVRSGASWSELERAYGRTSVRADHLTIAQQLLALYRRTRSGTLYGSVEMFLDELGPGAWPLLEQARRVGVEIFAEDPDVAVDLRFSTAEVTLDIDTRPDGGLVVRPVVVADGEVLAGSASVLGDPGHGVVVDQEQRWRLLPLAGAPHSVLAGLLAARRTLTIPADDADRFLGVFYPSLRRMVTVTNRSGAVELPEILPPVLRLAVAHGDDHTSTLTWGFHYPTTSTDVPLDPDGPSPVARDVDTERQLRATVAAEPVLGAVEGLRGPTPTGWGLAPTAVVRGLDIALLRTDFLPRLRELGVVVEETGEPATYRHVTDAPVISVGVSDSADRDWFDLAVSVHVGAEEAPLADLLRALAAGDDHLLLDSGTYFALDRPELDTLRRLVEEARDLVDKDTDGLRLSVFQADLWAQLVELGVVAEQSARWSSRIDGLLAGVDADPPAVPAGLDATLRPYQLAGYHWLCLLWDAGLGGVLADDMGLGKTLQTLTAVQRALEAGELTEPVLVVAPTSVVATWAAEAARFTPGLRAVTVTETRRRRGTPLAQVVEGAHLVVTSYALVRIDDEEYRSMPWRCVVLDEAQFVKNHRSKTYAAIRRLETQSVLAITGTPLENSLMDLWSVLSLTAPGLFASPERFGERFRKPIEAGVPGDHLARLRRRIRPFVLRRTKELVASDLPPKMEQVLSVPLAPAHRTIYDRHLQRERQRLLGLLDDLPKNRVAILAALTTLRQMSLDPALVDVKYAGAAQSAKIDLLVEHLTELKAEGHRVLVFSQFTRYLRHVRDRLEAEGISTVYLDGRTRDRGARIEAFRTGDAIAFLISLKAGGFGLTLTEADYVYVLDPWWNPAAEEQAIDRAHRIGQDKPVNVYRLVSADTIEEKVRDLQLRKQSLFDAVVDDEGALSGALQAADIRALLADD